MLKFALLVLLSAALVSGQSATRPLLTVCDVVKNPKRYHKKVIYLKAMMDSHIEGILLRPEKGCTVQDGISFDTDDEDFMELNSSEMRIKFEEALNPSNFIPADKQHISKYAFVARTGLKVKGYFIASDKREFGGLNRNKYLISIRQIQEIGEPRLIEVNSQELLGRETVGRQKPTFLADDDLYRWQNNDNVHSHN